MNLADAIAKHVEWRTKFRTAIRKKEKVDVATLRSDGRCGLGKWLQGEGQTAFRGVPEYAAVQQHHAQFHRVAARVGDAINAGNYAEAEKMLANGTEYALASMEVAKAIVALQAKTAQP